MRLALFFIVLAGLARIVATYPYLTHTIDEPLQIACGLEWLEQHTYTYDKQHPPLPRIFAGIGAHLAGVKNVTRENFSYSNAMLYEAPSYGRALGWARAGELPFFILAAVVVWLWARRLHGEKAAIASALLFTSLPPVLAHAGLATTDMATCGTLIAAVYAWVLWLEDCSPRRAAVLGICAALGFLSKYTFLVFFPLLALVAVALNSGWRGGRRAASLAGALAVFCLIVWGAFWFRFTPVSTEEGESGESFQCSQNA